jgi:hypothetical protein
MKEKMKMYATEIKYALIGLSVIVLILFAVSYNGFVSDHNVLENEFVKQSTQERPLIFDAMRKNITMKGKVVLKADSSGLRYMQTIMAARDNKGQDAFISMVREQNPELPQLEIIKMYQDLSSVIESSRADLIIVEKKIQYTVEAHSNLITASFTGRMWNSIKGYEKFKYKPITSTYTDEVSRTSHDDNMDVF